MGFGRRGNNRRAPRQNVLDVRLRTRQVRAARWRLGLTAVTVALGALVVLYALWRAGEWGLNRFVFGNDAFAVRRLEITTDGRIPRSLLEQWSGVKPGVNLMALDLGGVERGLKLMPLVANAAVQRVPPDTLRIRIQERVPVAEVRLAQLRRGGGIEVTRWYLDESGHVIPFSPEWPAGLLEVMGCEALPRLTGVDPSWIHPGRPVELPAVGSALRLLVAFQRSEMGSLLDLESVDVSRGDVLEATTRAGSRIVFGLGAPDEALRRWKLVHDHFARQGSVIQRLDLSVANNSPVVLYDPQSAPAEPPKSVKPSRNRKPHV